MTYYKYAERDATSQVNWADVSKKFSDEISRIGGERDKKRAEIDKATDALVTKINEAPLGQHKNANLFTSQLVDQATQDTLRMNKLLKSGDIRPSEYMNYIENQKSSVTGIYDMVKGYQDVYTDKMTRMQNGESLSPESDGMAVVEGFGNFANITPVMDMYGNVTMYNNSTSETMSAAQMNAITKQYFNAYDLDGDLTAKAAQLGEYTKSIMDGGVKTREDVTASPAYQKVKGDLIGATLEGNLSVTTVLDRKLPGYSTSYSPKTAGANDILMIDDPRQPGSGAQIPLVEVVEQVSRMTDDQKREIFPEGADVDGLIKIAEDQREAARKWAEADLTSRFNMIETPQAATTSGDSDAARKARERAKREARMITNWDILGTGTPEDQTIAAEAIVGMLNEGKEADERIVDRIVPDESGRQVTFFYPDGTSRNVSLVDEDGNRLDRSQWLSEGTEFHGVEGDYGRFYEGGIVPSGGTELKRGQRTVGYEEPAVGYNTEIQGFDDEGKLIDVTPRSSYVASTAADQSSTNVTSAALGALSAMNFDNPQVSVLEIDRINDIDLPGIQSWWTNNRFEDAVKYFVPEVMPYQVFVPEDGANNVVGRLNELVAEARAQGRQVTIEELKAAIGPNNYEIYNTQTMRDANPIEFGAVENPNENTPEVDAFGNPI
jgi:hypothetical protein